MFRFYEGIRKNYQAFGGVMMAMSRMEDLDETCLDGVREDYNRRSGKGK